MWDVFVLPIRLVLCKRRVRNRAMPRPPRVIPFGAEIDDDGTNFHLWALKIRRVDALIAHCKLDGSRRYIPLIRACRPILVGLTTSDAFDLYLGAAADISRAAAPAHSRPMPVFLAIGVLAYNLYLGVRRQALGSEWGRSQVQSVPAPGRPAPICR